MLSYFGTSTCDVCLLAFGVESRDRTTHARVISCGHTFCLSCYSAIGTLCPVCAKSFEVNLTRKLTVSTEDGLLHTEDHWPHSGFHHPTLITDEASRLQAAMTKVVNEGASEAFVQALVYECFSFLDDQPDLSQTGNLHLNAQMMAYLAYSRSKCLRQATTIERLKGTVQQLTVAKREFQKRCLDLESEREADIFIAFASENILREHCMKLREQYTVLARKYNAIVSEHSSFDVNRLNTPRLSPAVSQVPETPTPPPVPSEGYAPANSSGTESPTSNSNPGSTKRHFISPFSQFQSRSRLPSPTHNSFMPQSTMDGYQHLRTLTVSETHPGFILARASANSPADSFTSPSTPNASPSSPLASAPTPYSTPVPGNQLGPPSRPLSHFHHLLDVYDAATSSFLDMFPSPPGSQHKPSIPNFGLQMGAAANAPNRESELGLESRIAAAISSSLVSSQATRNALRHNRYESDPIPTVASSHDRNDDASHLPGPPSSRRPVRDRRNTISHPPSFDELRQTAQGQARSQLFSRKGTNGFPTPSPAPAPALPLPPPPLPVTSSSSSVTPESEHTPQAGSFLRAEDDRPHETASSFFSDDEGFDSARPPLPPMPRTRSDVGLTNGVQRPVGVYTNAAQAPLPPPPPPPPGGEARDSDSILLRAPRMRQLSLASMLSANSSNPDSNRSSLNPNNFNAFNVDPSRLSSMTNATNATMTGSILSEASSWGTISSHGGSRAMSMMSSEGSSVADMPLIGFHNMLPSMATTSLAGSVDGSVGSTAGAASVNGGSDDPNLGGGRLGASMNGGASGTDSASIVAVRRRRIASTSTPRAEREERRRSFIGLTSDDDSEGSS